MKKKAYIYTLDVIIAIVILIVGLIVLYSFHIYAPQKEKTTSISQDIVGLLHETKIYELRLGSPTECNSYSYSTLDELCVSGDLFNDRISVLELLGQLYHENQREMIERIVDEMIIQPRIVPPGYKLEIILFDPGTDSYEQLYPLVEVTG
ncbi:hypothetical protein JXA85_06165 [Candidatus Woesearchaeota archaeon]|nr:hypothetical protein [Candidatus Woesearchaeota archaeon]